MIDQASSSDPEVLRLLRQHPAVAQVEEGEFPLLFSHQGRSRRILVADTSSHIRGLPEFLSHEALREAEQISLPSPAATLTLIAMMPLVAAGLLVESPTAMSNADLDDEELAEILHGSGWDEGATTHVEPIDLGGVIAVTTIGAIRTPSNLDLLDALYASAYRSSPLVRSGEKAEWDVSQVSHQPHALYRLRIAPDEPYSLLTIQTMGNRNGKCGAAQVVQAMELMAT